MASGGGNAAAAAATAKDVVDAEVVIVGGGIAGLATALALRRAGAAARRVLVLERHAGLRATGAALTVFPNGWFALRALGVAHKLASRYDAYETCVRPVGVGVARAELKSNPIRARFAMLALD